MMGVLKLLSALFLLSLLRPGLSHVVDMFSDECEMFFLNGKTPNIPGILVDGNVKNQNRYKPICQFFNNRYRFATLYDTTNLIPVFSAYKFTGSSAGRPDIPWMIEPQLNHNNADESMRESWDVLYRHQAGNRDYINPIEDVNRGHLFPCCHAHDDENKMSTFTLTNIVPQYKTFNGGSWSTMETNVRKYIQEHCLDNNEYIKAYVVTGAVPSKNPVKKLNNRVNIPSSMWTAYCCHNLQTNQWNSGAHWGENTKDGKTNPLSVADLNSRLKDVYKDGFQLFPKECL